MDKFLTKISYFHFFPINILFIYSCGVFFIF